MKWCHGAAGIALARVACRRVTAITGIEGEIDAALRATEARYLQDTDV